MAKEVSRTTFRERFQHLEQTLIDQIRTGELAPGAYMPSENELAQAFQLSRPSVRKILAKLAEEGLVRTQHGVGTIVNGPGAPPVKLHLYWGMPSYEFETINALIDQFNRTHPRIQVEIVKTPRGALSASAREGFQVSGKKPDLIGMSNTLFHQWTSGRPERFLRPVKLEDVSPFYEPCLRAFTCDGRLLAAPMTFAPIVLVYNKSMFDAAGLAYPEAGWTWERLLEAARALTRFEGDQTEQYGFSFSASFNRWPLFVLQNGGVFRRDDELLPSEPAALDALQFAVDLMYKHKVAPIFATENFRLGELLFLREKVGMILTSYIFLEEFRSIGFEWDLVRFPGQLPDTGLGLATGIGITSQCEAPEEAGQVLEFLVSPEAQAHLKRHVCSIPARRSVAEDRDIPPPPAAGDSYYAFEALKDHFLTVMDFGLTYAQLVELDHELGLVWANVSTVEEMWTKLQASWAAAKEA